MANDTAPRYWRNLDERDAGQGGPCGTDEFIEPVLPDLFPRRGFLKAAGFGLAALAAGCTRAPVEKAIPFLVNPEEITPGRSLYYASTCAGCSAACGLLVKSRDGRPIKLEGNPQHPLSRGGLCAVGQASVLELYDNRRLAAPQRRGQNAPWAEIDTEIVARLGEVRRRGQRVRVLTGSVVSPTLQAAIGRFLSSFDDARHVVYDALSSAAILEAHEMRLGLLEAVRTDTQATHYAAILGEEVEAADVDRARRFVALRRVLPEGDVRAIGELQRVVVSHRESKNANRHLLELADLYAALAEEYVAANPPEGLGFDPPGFQDLVDSASRLYEAVANQDGTTEKLEAQRRLEAFLAFTLRVDRDRFSR